MNDFNTLIESVRAVLSANTDKVKKVRNAFYLKLNGNWCTVDFQKSTSSTAIATKFTINIGIAVKELTEFYGHSLENPETAVYPISGRIGFFLPVKQDCWWTISDDDRGAAVMNEILKIVTTFLVPFFERYSNASTVLAEAMDENSDIVRGDRRLLILMLLYRKEGRSLDSLVKDMQARLDTRSR